MPYYWQILLIARVTIDTLKEIGITHCCFIGGMACKLYTNGKGRQPKVSHCRETRMHPILTLRSHQDLDILCLTPYPGGAEAIKSRLCQEDDRFYTVPARNPRDRWRVLYWRTGSNEPGFKRFKVDILVPGVMDLPAIHPNYIIKINKYPCAPLVLLLLHKLKGWDDRRDSRRQYQLDKIPGDVRDIKNLLRIANQRGLRITKPRGYISRAFRADSKRRVIEFSEEHPQYIRLWTGLGLPDHLFDEL